jgi:hypothetical protein
MFHPIQPIPRELVCATRPTAQQLADYTGGYDLPAVSQIEFKPGHRGRPIPGGEKRVVHSVDEVRKILADGTYALYRKVVVRFQDDCHIYEGTVVCQKREVALAVLGLGTVCSVIRR